MTATTYQQLSCLVVVGDSLLPRRDLGPLALSLGRATGLQESMGPAGGSWRQAGRVGGQEAAVRRRWRRLGPPGACAWHTVSVGSIAAPCSMPGLTNGIRVRETASIDAKNRLSIYSPTIRHCR